MYSLPSIFCPFLIAVPSSLTCAPQYISDLEKWTSTILFIFAVFIICLISGCRSILDAIRAFIIAIFFLSQHPTSNSTFHFFIAPFPPDDLASTAVLFAKFSLTISTNSGLCVHEYLSAWNACSTDGYRLPSYITSWSLKFERSFIAEGLNGGSVFLDFEWNWMIVIVY